MSERTHSDEGHLQRQLIGLGFASFALVLLIALLSRRFAIAVPSVERPHVLMWGLFTLHFGVYLVALPIAARIRDTWRVVPVVGLFAVLFRGLLLFTTPIQEIDLYRYVWDGHVVVSGVDPYRYSPQNVIDASTWAVEEPATVTGHAVRADGPLPNDSLLRLVALQRRSPALGQILRTIHYADLPTPYPPVSQFVFALAARTTPDQAIAHTHLVVMKAWIVLFDLLTLVAIVALLKSTGLPAGWCLAYAWCPLVLKEFANSGHLDAIAVVLTTTSLRMLIGIPRHRGYWHVLTSAGLLGLGIGAKLYPVILLPVILTWLARQCRWPMAGVFALVAGGVGSLVLWPMWGIDRPRDMGVAPPVASPSVPPLPTDLDAREDSAESAPNRTRSELAPVRAGGLGAFLTRWKMNDFLFLIVNENLDPSAPTSRQPWFAMLPESVRMAVISPIMRAQHVGASAAAFLVARAVTLGIFGLLTLWWIGTLWREGAQTGPQKTQLLERLFLTLAWFWLLAPTQNPWYWIWCLPLLPFARGRAWLWVSGLVMTYYLRFWLNAHWPEPPGPFGSRHAGSSFFDFNLVWFEYVPFFCGLLVGGLFRRRRHHQ